jgi:hypothetical protein
MARMDNVACHGLIAEILPERLDGGSHGRGRRRGKLHLDGDEFSTGRNHDVNLSAGGGTPEIDLGIDTTMGKGFDNFGKHRSFQDRAAHGTCRRVFRVSQAGKMAECPEIVFMRSGVIPETSFLFHYPDPK